MALKFLDKPFVARNPRSAENIAARAPAGALPIHSAPETDKFVAVDANGKQHWAMRHRGRIEKLTVHKDFRSGASRLLGTGESLNAVWWLPPRGR
jgi:hypothetical protein